jgi:hypothetical protein
LGEIRSDQGAASRWHAHTQTLRRDLSITHTSHAEKGPFRP